jgi:Dolichyl-phosphate-mannose-protein mannosyltransferase
MLAVAALVVSLYLTYGIDRSLWLDEANSVHIAKGSPKQIIDALSLDVSPPLYYFVLAGWMRAFGDSEAVVRIPSVLFYLAGIFVAWHLGRMLLGSDGAWLTAFVYAVSTVAGRQAQNARMYTMLALVAGLSMLAFATLMRDKHRRTPAWFALFGLIAFLGLNTHYWFAFVLAAFGIWVLFTARSWRLTELVLLASFTVVPFIVVNLGMFFEQEALAATGWTPEPGLSTIAHSIAAHFGLIPLTSLRSLVIGSLMICLFVVCAARQGWKPVVTNGRTLGFLGCLYLVTIGLPFVISLWKPIYFPGRYDIVALPLFSLCLAALLLQLGLRWRIAFQLLLAGSCFIYFFGEVRNSNRTGHLATLEAVPLGDRPAATVICAQAAPGDFVVYTGLSRASISYYLQRFGCAQNLNQVSFPGEFERHMGWLDVARDYSAEHSVKLEAEAIAERASTTGARMFVLVQPATRLSGAIIDAIERRFRRESSQQFASCEWCFRELRIYQPDWERR